MIETGFEHLNARISDLANKAQRGSLAVSDFLTPKEQYMAEIHLKKFHSETQFAFFGGYAAAERKRLYLLPDYIPHFEENSPYIQTDIASVFVCGSGYRELSHRDYLGSVLGLGIERETVGDILPASDGKPSAYIYITEKMADFLVAELSFVASDKVKAYRKELPEDFAPSKKTLEIRDTIPSARLDCIVATLCNISREKAKTAVEAGIVDCNYETQTRPDRQPNVPCVISIRGYGKFNIISASELTKKGRIRFVAEKFI